jgi:thioredoxin reductase (NADPH)
MLDRHAGEHVVLVGGGNSCAQLALALDKPEVGAKSVTIITRSLMTETTSLYLRSRLAQSNVKVIVGEVEKAYGAEHKVWDDQFFVNRLKIVRGERFAKTIKADQVYVFISGIPPTGWFAGALDASGYILTGHDVPVEDWPLSRHPLPQETSIPGVFAAGDIRAGATGGITVAFGEGTQAFQHIKRTYLPELEAESTPAKEEVHA